MPRQHRIQYPGATYHVMARGNRRETIFRGDQDCRAFLDRLDTACGRTGWEIRAFVLMNNHY
jgi:REP element-mobilizing transposase RayT